MAYRDELEAARARINQLERELAECQARLTEAHKREQSVGHLSKRERRQRRRTLEARRRSPQRDAGKVAGKDRWLGRAASPVGFLLVLTPLLVGCCFALALLLGATTLLTEVGLAPRMSGSFYLAALLGVPALALGVFIITTALVAYAARNERRWARSLPFTLERYHALYDAFMAADRTLLCRATTTSVARSASIVDDAGTLARHLDTDAEVGWHDGHLELELPLPPISSAWRAARQARATVHALVERVLIPLHATHPLEHITLHTRM